MRERKGRHEGVGEVKGRDKVKYIFIDLCDLVPSIYRKVKTSG